MSAQSTPAAARLAYVEACACVLGEAWAKRSRAALSAEGRRLSGGWPGTLTEARAQARVHFAAPAARQQLGALTVEEFERAVRLAYARARAVWLAGVEPDDDDDEDD